MQENKSKTRRCEQSNKSFPREILHGDATQKLSPQNDRYKQHSHNNIKILSHLHHTLRIERTQLIIQSVPLVLRKQFNENDNDVENLHYPKMDPLITKNSIISRQIKSENSSLIVRN